MLGGVANQGVNRFGGDGIKAVGRFVEEEHLGVADEGTRHHEALLHALRVASDMFLFAAAEADLFEQTHGVEAVYFVEFSEEYEVFDGAHLLVEVGEFKGDANFLLNLFALLNDVHAKEGG